MLREAFRAVNENVKILAIYLAVDAPITLAFSALNDLYLKPREEELGERIIGMAATAEMIVNVFVTALLFSIVLAYLARELDKPLWKVHGPGDALARFFPMWLIFIFPCGALAQFGMMLQKAGYEGASQTCFMLYFILNLVVLPLGTIVMFLGNGNGEDLRAAVTTVLPRILDRFFLAMFIGFFQIITITMLFIDESTTFWMRPIISGMNTYINFVLFAYIFLSCREQRDLEEPQDPYDF